MIGGFYGYRRTIADYRKQLRTGKVTSGTLKVRIAGGADTFTDIPWSNLYVWPQTEVSGFEGTGMSDTNGQLTLYRINESDSPRVDDQIVTGGTTFMIRRVTPRLNADESSSFAVYDCDVTS